MENKKIKILDFFFDGDPIITMPQGYTNISKVLEAENYKFITNDEESDLKTFFMHALLESSIKQTNTINMVLRVPSGKRDIQEELRELIHVQEILGSDKCTWSVIEDIYNKTKMQVGLLAYSPTE